jgi:hypothetical protein
MRFVEMHLGAVTITGLEEIRAPISELAPLPSTGLASRNFGKTGFAGPID